MASSPLLESQRRPDRLSYLTSETCEGQAALDEVMCHSYHVDVGSVPPEWARIRLVDGIPVSFIVIDPRREMAFQRGCLPYAFICDVATRDDRRNEGHFRALVEDAFAWIRDAGASAVVTHGRADLYRRFGFEIFTHQHGLFVEPEAIERVPAERASPTDDALISVEHGRHLRPELLLVTDVRADTPREAVFALRAAAAAARLEGKTEILFEHPAAPSYGSLYPGHAMLDDVFSRVALACGAREVLVGSEPEGRPIPDADWIKVLDAAGFVRQAIRCSSPAESAPRTAVRLGTDAGDRAIDCRSGEAKVYAEPTVEADTASWPSSALAQLVTGYRSAEVLDAMLNSGLPDEAIRLLDALFPRTWRLSRNESWTYWA